MSTCRFTALLATLAAVLLMASPVAAQHHGPAQTYHPQMFQPLIDPLRFDPDWQFFAPAELGEFGLPDRAKTGWFGQYGRMYVWTSRPDLGTVPGAQPAPTVDLSGNAFATGDWTYGNRFDLGYMTTDDHGWLFSGMHIDGPNAVQLNFIERVNRFNMDDDPNDQGNNNQGGGGGGGQGGGQNQAMSIFPRTDRNNIDTFERDFESKQSLNVGDLSGIEINKLFRLKRFHNGSVLEPFFGFRYIKFTDVLRRDSYQRVDEDTGIPTGLPIDADQLEQIRIDLANWDNHLVGGQLGFRWYQQVSRWTISSELRAFAFNNFQFFSRNTTTEQFLYNGDDIDAQTFDQDVFFANDAEFVYGLDIRSDAAFELTRDISIFGGVQYLEFFRGIARGNDVNHNDETMLMFGVVGGIIVNR